MCGGIPKNSAPPSSKSANRHAYIIYMLEKTVINTIYVLQPVICKKIHIIMARFIVLLMAGVLAVAGSVCQAQKVDFGVLAGLVFSHPKDYNTRTGFSVGAKGIYTFRENSSSWFVEAQAKLVSKGWKYDIATYDEGGNLIYYSDWTCNAYYLEIPVYAGYKFKVNDNCGIFIEAGPYLAAGLFGNSDVKGGRT